MPREQRLQAHWAIAKNEWGDNDILEGLQTLAPCVCESGLQPRDLFGLRVRIELPGHIYFGIPRVAQGVPEDMNLLGWEVIFLNLLHNFWIVDGFNGVYVIKINF